MSAYRSQLNVSFSVPASTVTPANGGFKDGDAVINRAVQKGTGDTVLLAADDANIIGTIDNVDGDTVNVNMGPIVNGLRGGDTALTVGRKVVGATRTVTGDTTGNRGYLKTAPADAANNAVGTGNVLDGGGTSTANQAAVRVEVFLWG